MIRLVGMHSLIFACKKVRFSHVTAHVEDHVICQILGTVYSGNKGSGQVDMALGWERSCSVVECLTRDQWAAGSSLIGVTALWSLSKTHLP